MKVERELCTKCLHTNEFHMVNGITNEVRCVYGQPVFAFNAEWHLVDEKPCKCKEFRP